MSEYKFHPSIPRKVYWSDAIASPFLCPECNGMLKSEHHAYLLFTRKCPDPGDYIIGTTAGRFCANCPLVVLDRDEFNDLVSSTISEDRNLQYAVAGIINFDAVPEDKRDLPFDDDNPAPVTPFTNIFRQPLPLGSRRTRGRMKITGRHKKKKRH